MDTLISHSFPLLIFLIFSICVSATQFNIPRLGAHRKRFQNEPKAMSPSDQFKDFKTFFYTQTLDHFNYRPDSYATFQQRYVINFKHWGGSNSSAPIFVYLGAEGSLDEDLDVAGFLPDNAPRFKALLVYIEHRYYGKSVPFGSREEAMKNASTLGYFNSAQAIADYADVLLHIKKKYSAERSPSIVVGGSYGGSKPLFKSLLIIITLIGTTCSEMVMPIGHGHKDTMFPPAPFDLNRFTKDCEGTFGVKPKPHWVTTYYGGRDLKLILHRFGSNIIFSNGLRDPYSTGGVLGNISDSVVAISTVNGSHCLDILPESKSDPQWLVMQRKAEIKIIEEWIAKYQNDLLEFKEETHA
ncbi:hypothetical protein WN943_026151 [Citrus x changshan-huyou]